MLFAVTSIVNGPAQRQRKKLQMRHQALVDVPGQGRKNMVLSWRTLYRYGMHSLASRELPFRIRTKLMWPCHVAPPGDYGTGYHTNLSCECTQFTCPIY